MRGVRNVSHLLHPVWSFLSTTVYLAGNQADYNFYGFLEPENIQTALGGRSVDIF